MGMANAKAGHAAEFWFVKDGDSAGTFTKLGNVISALDAGDQTRSTKRLVSRGATAPTYLASAVADRSTFGLRIAEDETDATHDSSTGILKRFEDADLTECNFRFPGYSVGSVGDLRMSCYITGHKLVAGLEADEYAVDLTFQPSGVYMWNGTETGSVD